MLWLDSVRHDIRHGCRLNAQESDAVHRDVLVLSSGMKPIAAGVCGGVVLAMLMSQALTQICTNTPIRLDPRDPLAYAVVTRLLAGTAIAAMFGPALRAASASPSTR